MKWKKASLARAAVMILMAAMLPLGALAGMMGMRGSPEIPIVELTGPTRPLFVPPVLEADGQEGGARHFTLTAGQGETEFFPGVKTETLGYNGNYLGPTLRFREGEEVRVTIQNRLTWETTVHWHGMKVPWEVDGHPHNAIAAGEDRDISFTVRQEAATLWYHPHTLHVTGKQVYRGLAGFLLIEDGSELSASLPKEYGVDDVPVAVQDRFFTRDGRTDYQNAYNPQGTYGNVILANGTPNAEFTATTRLVRLRLLNGSNARTYDFTLGDGRSFLQVGTDGGLLDAPFETDSVTLTPGERADIVVSLDGMAAGASVDLLGSGARVLRLAAAGTLVDNGRVGETLNRLPDAPDPGGTDRRFDLSGMGMMFMINGQAYDPHRVDERGVTGRDEVWEIRNLRDMMGGMVHNFHLHGTQFRVLTRNGAAPAPGERGWKDTVALMPGEAVRILVRFEDEGLFMYHCHILEHEDLGMMGQIEVTAP